MHGQQNIKYSKVIEQVNVFNGICMNILSNLHDYHLEVYIFQKTNCPTVSTKRMV
jgi:hypothetical protein